MKPRTRLAAAMGVLVGTAAGVGITMSGSLTSCTSTPTADGPAPTKGRSAPATCRERIELPHFAPTPPPRSEPSDSELVVRVTVKRDELVRAMDSQVPKSLGGATRKPIGTPGELTYRVSRGTPDLALEEGVLIARLPIHAGVEICKPFGRICPTYGACQPDLLSETRLPLVLGPSYERAPVEVKVSVTRGCRVAGIDVTDRVTSAAGGATRVAERRIERAIPAIPPLIARAGRQLTRPLRLDDETCFEMIPATVRQWKPREQEGNFEAVFAVRGRLEPASCDARFEAPALPELTLASGEPPTSTWFTERRLPYETLAASIVASGSTGRAGPTAVTDVTVRPHHDAEGDRLALRLDLEGQTCGRTWLFARPRLSEAGLHLDAVTPVGEGAEGLTDVMDRLAGPFPLAAGGGPSAAKMLRERLAAFEGVEGLEVAIENVAESRTLRLDRDHLVVVTETRGHLVVSLSESGLVTAFGPPK